MSINLLPPNNAEAEDALLHAIILQPELLDEFSGQIVPAHFYTESRRQLAEAIVKLHTTRQPVDMLTIQQVISGWESDALQDWHWRMLERYPVTVPDPTGALNIVRSLATRRSVIRASSQAAQLAYDSETPVSTVAETAQQLIFEATTQADDRRRLTPLSDDILLYLSQIEDAMENPRELTGLSSGLIDVDRIVRGFRKSDSIIIAGGTSMGKTAAALGIVDSFANKNKTGIIFSLEMSKQQLLNRIASMRIGRSWTDLQTGKITQDEYSRLLEEMGRLSESDIVIDDNSHQTPATIRSTVRQFTAKTGRLDFVVVDYLQLVDSSEKTTYDRSTAISKSMKQLAREFDVPVITLCQINRANAHAADKRPTINSLRDSGRIEEDADVIVLIYRDAYYNTATEHPDDAEWIIAKNRTGGTTGTATVRFFETCGQFRNAAL